MTTYAPCPECRSTDAEKLKFTWWGGVLGPKLLTHVKCRGCGKQFNGKTGKDNTTNIVINFVIVGAICLGLAVFVITALGVLMYSTS